MQTARVVKRNGSNAGTATPTYDLILSGAESFAGKLVTVAGVKASGVVEPITKPVADGKGGFTDAPTERVSVRFTRTPENGADIRTVKRLAPGSTVEIAEVTS